MVVKAYLKNDLYDIDFAENAALAVDRFAIGNYDLVLMNIRIPWMGMRRPEEFERGNVNTTGHPCR